MTKSIQIADVKIDYPLLAKFPAEFLIKNLFFPIEEHDGSIAIAMPDPENLDKIGMIENFTRKKVVPFLANRDELEKFLKKSDTYTKVLRDKTETFALRKTSETEDDDAVVTIESVTEEDDSVIQLLNNIILTAVNKKASDIHIEIGGDALVIKYRIDGILHQIMEPLDSAFHSFLLTRLKVISELDIAEKRVPQDGRFRMKFKQKTIDFRVSIMPGIYGENAVIRILDREMITENIGELKLKQLGFSPDILEKINYYIRQPYGMFLVTGPTGSGKTTTLYAALNEIKDPADKIITIEDPVEYQVEGIIQIPVNEKKGLTFARGLRSILRHDPDKIMVGEIRDPETAQIAIQSALTGHLVFTTVHANNVFDVLGRFIHMGIDTYSFISALNCIAAQRLVRILCPLCRKPVSLDKAELAYNRIDQNFFSQPVFRAGGCEECSGLGYSGRTAIGEILELTDEIKEMILARKPTSEIKKVAMEQGMTPIRGNGLARVRAGVTSIEELNRVTVKEWV
ncbi:MAG: GspE/PulE family protein [Acidobacteriota bacterium]|jgi:type IV pilus assembly protein PilB|nr:GspE/PulE family protein [Acidobacteriota bacterium]